MRAATVIFALVSTGCGTARPTAPPPPDTVPPKKVTVLSEAMGGPVNVTIRCPSPVERETCDHAAATARDEVARIDRLATDWTPEGEVAQLNAAAGRGPMTVSPEVGELLEASRRVSEATDGAFDVTINALWGLWDFKEGHIADPDAISARLPLVDWQGAHAEQGAGGAWTAWLEKPGMSVTLGGIAQGYGAARALAGIPQPEAMVDISGDVAVRGTWTVGVQHPRAPRGTLLATLALTDAVIVTSGDYEKYFEVDGTRYHHILDPRTGMPAQGAISATVVHPEGAVADALATALLVSGAREEPVTRLDAWALVVLADGRVLELGDAHGKVADLAMVEGTRP